MLKQDGIYIQVFLQNYYIYTTQYQRKIHEKMTNIWLYIVATALEPVFKSIYHGTNHSSFLFTKDHCSLGGKTLPLLSFS